MNHIQVKAHLYNNQKTFRVNKVKGRRNVNDIRVDNIYKDDLLRATKELTHSGLKLYIYLLTNQEQYVGALSRKDVINKTGLSERSYTNAIRELEQKGLFVRTGLYCEDAEKNIAELNDFKSYFD